jgi:Protein of unknown function (DUF559)
MASQFERFRFPQVKLLKYLNQFCEQISLFAKKRNRLRANSLAPPAKSEVRKLQIPATTSHFDRYTLDFYSPEAHLAIELDGGGHERMRHQIHDRERTEILASQEILVLRFWNHQVREELDSVLQAIWLTLEKRCPHNPSP